MGFLKRFFRNVFRDGAPAQIPSSFEHLSEEELEAHLGVVRYGDFVLTDAVRPSYDLQVVPSQGFRHDVYVDESSKTRVPVLMARRHVRKSCSRRSSTCSIRWATRSTWCSKPATTATPRPRRSVPRAHRPAGAQEHALRLRRPAGQRRLHGHRRARTRTSRRKCSSTSTSC